MGSGSTVGSPTVIGMSAGRIGDKYFVVKSRGGKQCGRGGNVGIAAENMKVECFRDSAWKVAAETLGSRRKTASVRCRRKVKCFRVIAFGSRRKRCVGAAKTNVKRLPRQGVVVNLMEGRGGDKCEMPSATRCCREQWQWCPRYGGNSERWK